MEWTIERIRELPPDNWLGIKRVGEHMWSMGGIHMGDELIIKCVEAAIDGAKLAIQDIMRVDPVAAEHIQDLLMEELYSNRKKDGLA